MMPQKEKINLSDVLVCEPEYPPGSRVCLEPEDIAEAERINREMKIVRRQAQVRFARSLELSRGLRLRSRA